MRNLIGKNRFKVRSSEFEVEDKRMKPGNETSGLKLGIGGEAR